MEEFYLTDGNWVKGVARRWAGFIKQNTNFNRSAFSIGKSVVFPNGETRKIIAVSESGPYLNIWLDGEVLSVEAVGSPNKFRAIQ